LEETRAALADARAAQLIQDKAHLETQLKLLQAQIEPHFLFNTLSNVVGMIHDQPDGAEQTLIHLTTLLRANLQRTRAKTTTIADELTIIEALLKINQIRMGERLRYEIQVDDDLGSLPFPPMLLQPLVENALKHGLEPLEEGGWVRISISATDDKLHIKIADTGVGLQSPAVKDDNGTGVGITNVQSRLTALFGDVAELRLEENQPGGMIAHLTVPRSLLAPPP
jgi:sensor histidine kinase YesM